MKKDDGYSFEEKDDSRTWTDELVQDCDRTPFVEEEELPLPVLEYLGEFKALIDACGQVSYYFNMRNFVRAGVNKAKIVAASYQHDLRYYNDQLNEWRVKAGRSFAVLSLHASKFGFEMPKTREEENDFLNNLAVKKDRRKAYKGYLDSCLKKEKVLSPQQLEAKFQQMLQKRLNKANKQ
ncbi:hypothetical protein J6T21_00570 [Candidatus Saccharibacteria bacterium]|nr:hypothetical protein [Candidatus Saccharibacteria bacterium]